MELNILPKILVIPLPKPVLLNTPVTTAITIPITATTPNSCPSGDANWLKTLAIDCIAYAMKFMKAVNRLVRELVRVEIAELMELDIELLIVFPVIKDGGGVLVVLSTFYITSTVFKDGGEVLVVIVILLYSNAEFIM